MDLLLPETGFFIWSFLIVLFLFALLPVLALVSILRARFEDSVTKLTWVLVAIFVPVAGPILYFAIGRKQRITTQYK